MAYFKSKQIFDISEIDAELLKVDCSLTTVKGDLLVEDDLLVRDLMGASGQNFPAVSGGANKNQLAKFLGTGQDTSNGAMYGAYAYENNSEFSSQVPENIKNVKYNFKGKNLVLNINNKNEFFHMSCKSSKIKTKSNNTIIGLFKCNAQDINVNDRYFKIVKDGVEMFFKEIKENVGIKTYDMFMYENLLSVKGETI